MSEKSPAPEQPRHEEARLARDLGTSPLVEVRGLVKVRAGAVIGIFVGPYDAEELMRTTAFSAELQANKEGAMQIGTLNDEVPVYLIAEDLP